MKVGFIGAGKVTATIGRHLINAGRTIVVSNSRGPETLGEFVAELGPGAIAATKPQAAECDIVILATKWVNVPAALKGVDWRGHLTSGKLAHERLNWRPTQPGVISDLDQPGCFKTRKL